jgi:hypothetical protein
MIMIIRIDTDNSVNHNHLKNPRSTYHGIKKTAAMATVCYVDISFAVQVCDASKAE